MAKKTAQKFKTLDGYKFDESNFPAKYVAKGYTLAGEKVPNEGDDSAEEMLYALAAYIDSDYWKHPMLFPNFYSCLKPTLTPNQQKLEFPKDFMPLLNKMKADREAAKEAKKIADKATAKERKAASEKRKEEYGYAYVDGKKQPLGGTMVVGPCIYMARGDSKAFGLWKYRVQPEDIILNWCSDKPAPKAPDGHHWKKVQHNTNTFEIAEYKANIGNKFEKSNWILFSAKADNKVEADQKKYVKALKLIKDWDKMEAHIEKGLKSKDPKVRECALIAYLVKTTSIRVGSYDTEGTEQENGVVGASTLRVSNIKLSCEE